MEFTVLPGQSKLVVAPVFPNFAQPQSGGYVLSSASQRMTKPSLMAAPKGPYWKNGVDEKLFALPSHAPLAVTNVTSGMEP